MKTLKLLLEWMDCLNTEYLTFIPAIFELSAIYMLSKKNKFVTQQYYIKTCLDSNYELKYNFDDNIINKSVCIVAELCYSIDGKTSENIFINCKLNDTLFNIEWVIDNLESDENILSYYIINDHNQVLSFYDIFTDTYKHNYKKIK